MPVARSFSAGRALNASATLPSSIPSGNVKKMDAGIIYTQLSKSRSCLLGEVYTTDGRIKAMDLEVLTDNKHFFPNYNAAPVIHTAVFDKYPEIAGLLDPVSSRLSTEVAQELNAKVDVDGQDPHIVAKDWLIKEGFIADG